MVWDVEIAEAFVPEILDLSRAVRVEFASLAGLLKVFGPQLARPHADGRFADHLENSGSKGGR